MQKKQESHVDSNINKVFHFLELKGIQSELIGSNSMKGILYANDYDLNTEMKITDSISVLNKLYKQYLTIFDKAYVNKDYYITDFKNGIYNNDPIRWSYDDMKKGNKIIDGHRYTFQECLLHNNNIIKLDLCYIHNNLFTDINMLYIFIISGSNHHDSNESNILHDFDIEIQHAKHDGNYFKVIKRKFSKSILQGKMNKKLLDLLNSEYGLMYKIINSLQLVHLMLIQDFKPIKNELIRINLEHIKHELSNLGLFDVTEYLDEINHILVEHDQNHMKLTLDIIINHIQHYFNSLLKKGYEHIIFGGKIGLKMNTMHKMLDNSYGKADDVNGYILDKSLSGKRSQVYHNSETNHLVVTHRGTKGIHDVKTDIKMMFGFKNGKRFKHGKKITDQAINKYKTDNTTIIGHSLGHSIAKEANKGHDKEMITLNGAVTPLDMFDKQKSNEHIIRSKYDPISALHTLNFYKKKQNTYTLDNNIINPLKSHSTDVLEDTKIN